MRIDEVDADGSPISAAHIGGRGRRPRSPHLSDHVPDHVPEQRSSRHAEPLEDRGREEPHPVEAHPNDRGVGDPRSQGGDGSGPPDSGRESGAARR